MIGSSEGEGRVMFRRYVTRSQLLEIISKVSNEYDSSEFHDERQLKNTVDKLVDLCLHAPGAQSMELFDILIEGLQKALEKSEQPFSGEDSLVDVPKLGGSPLLPFS